MGQLRSPRIGQLHWDIAAVADRISLKTIGVIALGWRPATVKRKRHPQMPVAWCLWSAKMLINGADVFALAQNVAISCWVAHCLGTLEVVAVNQVAATL